MLQVLDSDSSKIIEAVRSTGVVITEAMRLYVDYIVSNMKAIGTWDLCNAVYGFVGGTAASHKFNWKDLRDVDAAFRLTFVGGVTHNANGMQGNGTNGYADTFYSTASNKKGLGYYVNTLGNVLATEIDMGTLASNNGFFLSNRVASGFIYGLIGNVPTITSSGNIPKGFYCLNSNSGSQSLVVNGSLLAKIALSGTVTDAQSIVIGARRELVPLYFSNKRFGFSYIANNDITDTQALQQSQIVTNAQNILNRA